MKICKLLNTFLILSIVFLLSGCSLIFEPKEYSEEEKAVLRKKVEVTKTNIVVPILTVIETSCQYYLKNKTWPKVQFNPSHSINFEIFNVVSDSDDNFNVFFKLKNSSISWDMVIVESAKKENGADCDFQVRGTVDTRDGVLKQTGKYKVGETFVTEKERMSLASRIYLFTEATEIINQVKLESSDSNELSNPIGEVLLQAIICVTLGLEPGSCN